MRKITVANKEKVLQISKEIWEGDDYIPQILDSWLSDPFGYFVGLFRDKELIAFGKMSYLTPTDVWLEGLRKDQRADVKGIAQFFTKYYLDILSQRHDITSVRFATYFENYGSIIPAERCGFQRKLTCSLKNFEIDCYEKVDMPEYITSDITYRDFKDFIFASKYLKKCKNLLSKGWAVYTITDQLLADFYTKEHFKVWKENEKIRGMILFCNVYYSDSFWISLLEAENDFILDSLLDTAKKVALDQQKGVMQILIPDNIDLLKWVDARKFTSWDRNNDFIVFDLPLKELAR